jgi:hypothetical protein
MIRRRRARRLAGMLYLDIAVARAAYLCPSDHETEALLRSAEDVLGCLIKALSRGGRDGLHTAFELVDALRAAYECGRRGKHGLALHRCVQSGERVLVVSGALDLLSAPGVHRSLVTLLDVSTWVIPLRHRRRYREEFQSELNEMAHRSWVRQAGYLVRLLSRMVALRRGLDIRAAFLGR